MNNIYLWLEDEVVDTFRDVSEVEYVGSNLKFNSDEGYVELKGLRATPLLAQEDVEINIDNYKKYILEETKEERDLESEIESLRRTVEELKSLLKSE